MARKRVVKWFEPSDEPTGWRKSDSQEVRIRKLVKSRGGNVLSAARAIQSLSNVTVDPETKKKARSDALLLYGRYRKSKKGRR